MQRSAAVVRLDLAEASIGAAGDAYRGVEGGGFGGLVWWRFHIADSNHMLADMRGDRLTHEAAMLTPMRAAASSKDFFSAGASRTATISVIRRRSVPLRRPRSESLMMCLLKWVRSRSGSSHCSSNVLRSRTDLDCWHAVTGLRADPSKPK